MIDRRGICISVLENKSSAETWETLKPLLYREPKRLTVATVQFDVMLSGGIIKK